MGCEDVFNHRLRRWALMIGSCFFLTAEAGKDAEEFLDEYRLVFF